MFSRLPEESLSPYSFELLFCLEDQRVGLIDFLRFFLHFTVGIRVSFRFRFHLLDLIVGETGRFLQSDVLRFAGGFIFAVTCRMPLASISKVT